MAEKMTAPKGLSISYRIKRSILSTSMYALAVHFDLVSRFSSDLKSEIEGWDDGMVFSLSTLPDGPAVSIKKEGDRIHYLGRGMKNPDLNVLFKNVDAAFLPFTAQMGAPVAFAQHRAIVHGNLGAAIKLLRGMNIVQTYLMPGFILKRNFKRPPKLTFSKLLLKLFLVTILPVGLIVNIAK